MQNIKKYLLVFALIASFASSLLAKRPKIVHAIKQGDLELVKELISKNKGLLLTKDSIKYVSSNTSLLHRTIYNRKPEILEYLLQEFKNNNIDINNWVDTDGRNAAFYAVYDADYTSLEILIEYGFDLNVKRKCTDYDGNITEESIYEAAPFGHGTDNSRIKCCNLLLKNGVRHNFSNGDLDSFTEYDSKEILEIAKKGMSVPSKIRYALWRLLCYLTDDKK